MPLRRPEYTRLDSSSEAGVQGGRCSWKKCIIRTIVFLLMLGALMGTKYCFFRLAGSIQLVFNATTANDIDHVTTIPLRIRSVRVMMMLFIILMVPCVINVLSALPELLPGGKRKSGEERKSRGKRKSARASPAPQGMGQQESAQQNTATSECCTPCCRYVACFLIAVLESFGLALFCFKILPGYDFVTSLLLMTSVVILPSRKVQFLVNKCDGAEVVAADRGSPWEVVVQFVGVIIQVGALVLTLVITWTTSELQTNFWHAPVAWVSLSLTWHLYPFVTIAAAGKQTQDPAGVSTNEIQPGNAQGQQTQPTEGEKQTGGDIEFDENVTIWRLSGIKSVVNIVCIFIFTFIFLCVDGTLYGADERWTEVMKEEFKAAWQWEWNSETQLALGMVSCGLLAYLLALSACQLRLAAWFLTLSIFGAMIIEGVIVMLVHHCVLTLRDSKYVCTDDYGSLSALHFLAVLGILGQVLSHWPEMWWDSPIVLQQESQVFHLPGFQFIALEQWLMKNRRWQPTTNGEGNTLPPTKVFICSTMYRETKHEMKTLLESIAKINDYKWEDNRTFECHIILDCGAKGNCVTPFAAQLVSLLPSTFNETLKPEVIPIPYGVRLKWKLPEKHGHQMTVYIHLKDPLKVKRKKRWSQVLYLNYVLKWFLKEDSTDQKMCGLENSFILATDGDVEFEPSSVKKLLDLMLRDKTVGGVCARTHPKGSGLVVWYQVFEYAIGHWFQKATEHILGSVLCAPGCFSVYRCQALLDVLDTYASSVEEAFDFLTKDMGEDRWLCTLMIQAGWRIDYCAAASCHTYCPEDFDEFFKQRRRWVVSTLANLKLLLTEGLKDSKMRGKRLFIWYQKLLLVASIVAPATVITFVARGLWYAWEINSYFTGISQLIMCAAFTFVCLLAQPATQLRLALVLCVLYAFTMTAVCVGAAQEIVEEVQINKREDSYNLLSLPFSLSTLYLLVTMSIIGLTALLHWEITILIRGILYIAVFPTIFIILNIYCLVNITDKSWGTREDQGGPSVEEHKQPQYIRLWNKVKNFFRCCKQRREQQQDHHQQQDPPETSEESGAEDETVNNENESEQQNPEVGVWLQKYFASLDPASVEHQQSTTRAVRQIRDKFRQNGFDYVRFISGMNQRELRDIGITNLGHLHFLSRKIEELRSFDIAPGIPKSVKDWLETIGLEQYSDNFDSALIREPKDLSVLKEFSAVDIRRDLNIHKVGHIKRLLYAIKQLRQSTEEGEPIPEEEKEFLENLVAGKLGLSPEESQAKGELQEGKPKQEDKFREEKEFLERLVATQLDPSPDEFRIEGELQEKLDKLRNSWLMILGVTNMIWLILTTTLASHSDLVILGINPLALLFMVVFGGVFALQLYCMVTHRLQSFKHFLACNESPPSGDSSSSSSCSAESSNETRSIIEVGQRGSAQAGTERL